MVSLGASFGLSVLIWQHIVGIELHWMVLPMAVIILLAVGADYNLLLVARFKEEIHAGLNTGIIRAMGGTGSVVTSAGLVFAFTMMSMSVSELTVIGQVGTTIGLGLLFDTLVVRSLMTPSIAALLGKWFWWPQMVGNGRCRRRGRRRRLPKDPQPAAGDVNGQITRSLEIVDRRIEEEPHGEQIACSRAPWRSGRGGHRCGGDDVRRTCGGRLDRGLPDTAPDHHHDVRHRAVHGGRPRHQPGVLRAVHDGPANRPPEVQQQAFDRIHWFFSLDSVARRQYSEDTATNVYYEFVATRWGNWAKLFFNNKGVVAKATDVCMNYPPGDMSVWDWPVAR